MILDYNAAEQLIAIAIRDASTRVDEVDAVAAPGDSQVGRQAAEPQLVSSPAAPALSP